MIRLCFPYMKDHGDASIINFGSGSDEMGMEGCAAHAAAKEAIRGLSRVVAREWGKHGIRVNTASPSAVTDNVMASLSTNPMCRPGDSYEDITPAVVFLASEDARRVTGQNLNIDGGGNIHS